IQFSILYDLLICLCTCLPGVMMDWPPQSPDLNPIEHIWSELENKLDRSIVHSKESIWVELQKAWGNISVEVLRKYIDTMPERCAAEIAAKGGHTRY
uniref:Tc1-like transposase DDE domain-containing protein n=1 Tax=Seriola dumerili TaxID=41447 RepID=A0A3B4VHU2_SERDU